MRKKVFCWLTIVALISTFSYALAEVDFTGMSFDELMKAQEQLTAALWASDEWEEVTVPAGLYRVGIDIPVGRWKISATKGSSTVFVGKVLNDTGTGLGAPYDFQLVSVKNEDYPLNVTWELNDGAYFAVENNPVLFTYATSDSLGFGKGKASSDSSNDTSSEELSELSARNEELQAQVSELQTRNEQLEKQVTELEEQASDLTIQISSLEAQINEQDIGSEDESLQQGTDNNTEETDEPMQKNEDEQKENITENETAQLETNEETEIEYEELKKGDKSEKVKALQRKLADKGFLKGSADGDYGNMTENAVKDFQMANGLEVTGIADNITQQLLFKVIPLDENTELTIGSEGDKVKEAQGRLIDLKYFTGKADGKFGNKFEEAVKDYQKRAGLEETGMINKRTWDSMFSGDALEAIVYEKLNYKELSRNPNEYEGKYYKFTGYIGWVTENVNDAEAYTTVTMGVNTKGRWDDDVYIVYDREDGERRFLEKDRVVIYAKFIGLYSYTTIRNELRTIPRFELEKIELQ